ncbi:zf-HC2 domain-containing protein [bacterium]|nr:zf-HC2 domain-containing protein [bacterium]
MRCGEAKKLISSYIDDELDLPTTRVVSMHLKRCADCQKHFDELRSMRVLVKRVNRIERDPALEQRLFNTIKVAQETPTFFEKLARAVNIDFRTASAVGVFVIALLVFLAGGPAAVLDYTSTYAKVSSEVIGEEFQETRSFWSELWLSGMDRIQGVSREILGEGDEVNKTETTGEDAGDQSSVIPSGGSDQEAELAYNIPASGDLI